jgi:hypothetical protein
MLLAGALAGIALGAGAGTAGAVTIVSTNNDTTSSALTQSGRMFRDGTPSSCDAPVKSPPPGVVDPLGTYKYRIHTFRSNILNPICFQVDVDSACAEVFSAAYAGAYNPSNLTANYAGDMGTSIGYPAYSFTIQPGSLAGVVINATSTSPSCGAYSIVLSTRGPWANTRPDVFGEAALGSALSGQDSTWAGAPTVARSWQRCDANGENCSAIPGATGTTYTVADADIGHTLRLRNDATDSDGASASQSEVVEPFIPFETHTGTLGPGDRVHNGIFIRTGIESRCSAPVPTPTVLQAIQNFTFESFRVTNLLNESVCLATRTETAAPFTCFGVTPEIFNPAFDPAAGLAHNYAANSGAGLGEPGTAGARMGAGESREVVVSNESFDSSCNSYRATIGADAPFATARPGLTGDAVRGGVLTASEGTWSGAPALARAWLRCDPSGAACSPIPGAEAASYVPTAADVGKRLRVRVTATRGRSVSSDSEPSAVVAPDTTPPGGTLRLLSRNLKRAVKSGRIPVALRCTEECAAVVDVKVSKRTARRLGLGRRTRIARGKVADAPAGRAKRVRAKLSRGARRALRSRRAAKVTIVAVLRDRSANRATLTKRGKLTRPRR